MMKIDVGGLEICACHGALPQEKVHPQPFVFDLGLEGDFTAAARGDDLSLTVNYAEVCALVKDVALSRSYNLLESLARGCALSVLERFPAVRKVTVTVHKPQAPIPEKFADVSVTYVAERNDVLLSLGSSMGDRRATLDSAIAALGRIRGVKIKRVSDDIATPPYGGVAQNEFLNRALLAECLLSPRELLNDIHAVEESLGRVRGTRWADRTVDIDIVFFGNKIIAEEGLTVPHPDYANRDFVLVPAKQIAPDFVCPVRRKMLRDM